MTPDQPEHLPGLLRARIARPAPARRSAVEVELAEVDPVARVLVDVPLAHLDRPFDYAVPATMADAAVAGVRVKVRFAGRDVDGFVLERAAGSDHPGRLTAVRRVVSPEPVLHPEVAGLVGAVATRYAGARSDVLRLAVPPRHATTEKKPSAEPPATSIWTAASAEEDWSGHDHAVAYLRRLGAPGSEAPRAVWAAPPGADWPRLLAQAVGAVHAAGRGAVACLPDVRDVARLDAALGAALGPGHHVTLTSDVGPARRYRDFLAVSRGMVRIAIGTRAAAFAPVADLGLVAIWDDGDDLFAEPRAPYPHTREVLLLRAEREGAAALLGGFGCSVEADHLVRTGWARRLGPSRDLVRRAARVTLAGASDHDRARDPAGGGARMPTQVRDVIRAGLSEGPVLVQTPRAGYALALACDRCRTPARCTVCAGPMRLTAATRPPSCRWCGTEAAPWSCPECGAHGLRAPVVGDARTAEELGRTFPAVRVLASSGERALPTVAASPAVVVATPGAEPVAEGGYAAVVLLDTRLSLARDDLRAAEESLRRWSNAIGLVRPGGVALAVGDPAHPALQALVRWDQEGFARREADERRRAHLPPATRVATVTGAPSAVEEVRALLELPTSVEVLGPVPVPATGPPTGSEAGRGADPGDGEGAEVRLILRTPLARGAALSAALGEAQRVRSARKLDAVRIQVDPLVL